MFSFLKNHPFAVEAFFESSTVLTFAVSKKELEHLIPESLELDLFEKKWAFVAVAMVETKSLRPKGFPQFLGNDFFLIGFRIFVRYHTSYGKRLRGLYILKSETDRGFMQLFGNIFTHYNYCKTDILIQTTENIKSIQSKKSDLLVEVEMSKSEVALPDNSPFSNWKEARRFAGPLPFTFSYDKRKKQMLIVEGVRNNWIPKPLGVNQYHIAFLDSLKLNGCVLANAFEVNQVPYYWKKGKIDQWKNENHIKEF